MAMAAGGRVGIAEVRQPMNGGDIGHIRSYLIGQILACQEVIPPFLQHHF